MPDAPDPSRALRRMRKSLARLLDRLFGGGDDEAAVDDEIVPRVHDAPSTKAWPKSRRDV